MIVKKTLSLKSIFEFSGCHLLWLTCWMLLMTSIYYFSHWKLMTLPWLPVSLIGTAVAFYVGFKNNHSYDRLWGGIKIWSEIKNNSRTFATMIRNYRSEEANPEDGTLIRKQIIFRHIGYLYQLREQLLEPMQWEHVSLKHVLGGGRYNRQRRARLINSYKEELDEIAKRNYLSEKERIHVQAHHNKAVQVLDIQSQMVQVLYANKGINMVQQLEIQGAINCFYNDQGNAERIKQSPFPRKYASFSFVFVCIFIFLLPFGIIGEFSKLGDGFVWLSVPVGVIISWVYVVMEMIGDYSENPFEGLHNDTPMLSICRDIEIDLLEMIGEKDIPKPIEPKGHVLL